MASVGASGHGAELQMQSEKFHMMAMCTISFPIERLHNITATKDVDNCKHMSKILNTPNTVENGPWNSTKSDASKHIGTYQYILRT